MDSDSLPTPNTPKSKEIIDTDHSLCDLDKEFLVRKNPSDDKEMSFSPELYERINKFFDKERLDITAVTNNINKKLPILKQVSLTLKRKSSDIVAPSKASTNDGGDSNSSLDSNIAMPRFLAKRAVSLLFDNNNEVHKGEEPPKSFIVSIVLEQSNPTETEIPDQEQSSITF